MKIEDSIAVYNKIVEESIGLLDKPVLTEHIVKGGTIILDTGDVIDHCVLEGVTLKTKVSLKIITSIIDGKGIRHTDFSEDGKDALIMNSRLENCKIPEAKYHNNLINGKPTGIGLEEI